MKLEKHLFYPAKTTETLADKDSQSVDMPVHNEAISLEGERRENSAVATLDEMAVESDTAFRAELKKTPQKGNVSRKIAIALSVFLVLGTGGAAVIGTQAGREKVKEVMNRGPLQGLRELCSDKNFYGRLNNVDGVAKQETGLSLEELRDLHRESLNVMLKDPRWAKIKQTYPPGLLEDATWGIAVYEMLAKNVLDHIADYTFKRATIGVFQTGLVEAAETLQSQELQKYLSVSGDEEAQKFIRQLPPGIDAKGITEILDRQGGLINYNAIHKSPVLSLVGHVGGVLWLADKLLEGTPDVTKFPLDLQTRILADIERGVQANYLLRDGTQKESKLQGQIGQMRRGEIAHITLFPGNDHMYDTFKKLGIAYFESNDITDID